jgi:hypothetical protein
MFGTALGRKLGAHAGLDGWEGVRLRFSCPSGVTVTTNDKNSLVIAQLAERVRILEAKIADTDTKNYFLDLAKKTLTDAVSFNRSNPPRLPEFMFALSISERLIQRAENAVSKYGPKLKIISG